MAWDADNRIKSTWSLWKEGKLSGSLRSATHDETFPANRYFPMLDGDYTLCGHRLQHRSIFGDKNPPGPSLHGRAFVPKRQNPDLDEQTTGEPSAGEPSAGEPENRKGRDVLPALPCCLDSALLRFCRNPAPGLERLHVGSLPSFGPLHHVELHGLAFLQALETTRVDCRVVHEDILTVLTRDKAEALRVIKPLHSTLFHFARISCIELRWMNRCEHWQNLAVGRVLRTPGSGLTLGIF